MEENVCWQREQKIEQAGQVAKGSDQRIRTGDLISSTWAGSRIRLFRV